MNKKLFSVNLRHEYAVDPGILTLEKRINENRIIEKKRLAFQEKQNSYPPKNKKARR